MMPDEQMPETARDMPTVIPRQPTMLEKMESRVKRRLGADDRTPMEIARDDYNQLREDNMHLIDEVRSVTIERDVLQQTLNATREEKAALQAKYDECAKRLGSMVQNMRTAGNSILEVIRAAEAAVVGDELAEYLPSGVGGKIQTS